MGLKLTKKQKEKLIKQFGHVPSKKEIFEKMKASQERLIYSLAGAWETAPDDPKIKNQLLRAIQKALNLRAKIYEMMGEKPPKISLSSAPPDLREKLGRLLSTKSKLVVETPGFFD